MSKRSKCPSCAYDQYKLCLKENLSYNTKRSRFCLDYEKKKDEEKSHDRPVIFESEFVYSKLY